MTAAGLLLDTHAFVWYAGDLRRIRPAVQQMIDDADAAFVSAASVWKIRTKFRIGKMPDAAAIAGRLPRVIEESGLQPLAVDVYDGDRAGAFPAALDAFGVGRVW